MRPEEVADLVQLRRARDFMDRNYAERLDVPALARTALMSTAHFAREFWGVRDCAFRDPSGNLVRIAQA